MNKTFFVCGYERSMMVTESDIVRDPFYIFCHSFEPIDFRFCCRFFLFFFLKRKRTKENLVTVLAEIIPRPLRIMHETVLSLRMCKRVKKKEKIYKY